MQLSNLLCAVAGQVEHLVALGANSATWASWKLTFWVKVRTQKESIYSIKVHFVGQFHSRTRHSSIGREPDPPMLGAPAWSHGPARVDAAVVKFQVWMCSMRRAAVTCLAHLENCSKIYVLYMCTCVRIYIYMSLMNCGSDCKMRSNFLDRGMLESMTRVGHWAWQNPNYEVEWWVGGLNFKRRSHPTHHSNKKSQGLRFRSLAYHARDCFVTS